jgi:hypothetical protein
MPVVLALKLLQNACVLVLVAQSDIFWLRCGWPCTQASFKEVAIRSGRVFGYLVSDG